MGEMNNSVRRSASGASIRAREVWPVEGEISVVSDKSAWISGQWDVLELQLDAGDLRIFEILRG